LEVCRTLMLAARFYAQTMGNLNTDLGHHEGPYGGSFGTADAFGDRMVSTRAANGIAGFWTPESAVQGWMDSPGHRRNILNPNITRMGTGFHLGGQWGVFGYQLFGGGAATPMLTDTEPVSSHTNPVVLADSVVGVFRQTHFGITGTDGLTLVLLSGEGSLPPGLTLDSARGYLEGTPTTAGTFVFAIAIALDGEIYSEPLWLSITVLP